MNDKIIAFIEKYIKLTPEEKEAISKQNVISGYPKDSILLKEGEYAKVCYFVLQGCVRSYHLVDGEEKTTEFYTENDTINPVSYVINQPSEYYLSCTEDCILALGNEESNQKLMEAVPRLGQMVMKMSGDLLVKNQLSLDDFKKLSPEMRYKKLLETRPDLFQRVPLYYIASYLGITPVSLSRMRKRIVSNAS